MKKYIHRCPVCGKRINGNYGDIIVYCSWDCWDVKRQELEAKEAIKNKESHLSPWELRARRIME